MRNDECARPRRRADGVGELEDFPDLILGETIYSGIVRHHRLSANPNRRTTIAEIFGPSMRRNPIQGSPSGIVAMSRALPIGHPGRALKRLVRDHTSFGFHTRYYSDAERNRALGIYLETGARGLRATVGAALIPASEDAAFPAYCPDCLEQDRGKLGTGIWRLPHQLPLVKRCHEHGTRLLIGCGKCGPLVSDGFVLALPGDACPCGNPSPLEVEGSGNEDFDKWFAVASFNALRLGSRGAGQDNAFELRDAVIAAGFVRRSSVDFASLIDAMRTHVEPNVVVKLGGPNISRWLRAMLSSKAKQPSTARVLCLLYTLEASRCTVARQPPPTAASKHPMTSVICNLYDEHRSIRGVATSLKLPWAQVHDVLIQQGVEVKKHAAPKNAVLRHEAIRKALLEGAAPNAVARRLGISVTTVRNAMRTVPALVAKVRDMSLGEKRLRYREALTAALRNHETKAEALRHVRFASAWLARHDRCWRDDLLSKVARPVTRRSTSRRRPPPRSDRAAIDAEWARLIRREASSAVEETPPVFVSQSHLIGRLGIHSRTAEVHFCGAVAYRSIRRLRTRRGRTSQRSHRPDGLAGRVSRHQDRHDRRRSSRSRMRAWRPRS
ncbi:hypothetical protein B1810_04080 [Panacagrimonas perspica]|uniref:TnsD family Tn7-like transposition protein n=1 Tax=Panacagrimonas perspica TaxID=381431 RepID=UPI001061B445|nr:hypothetical protein B1810_04080 [Panacagrimonas perspica]